VRRFSGDLDVPQRETGPDCGDSKAPSQLWWKQCVTGEGFAEHVTLSYRNRKWGPWYESPGGAYIRHWRYLWRMAVMGGGLNIKRKAVAKRCTIDSH